MATPVMELRLLSGDKLEAPVWWRILSLGRKLHTYAKVQILGRWGDRCQVNPSTAIDKVGENNPEWNHSFLFTGVDSRVKVDESRYRVSIKIYAAATGLMRRDQLIGETSFYMHKVLYEEGPDPVKYNLDKGTGGIWLRPKGSTHELPLHTLCIKFNIQRHGINSTIIS